MYRQYGPIPIIKRDRFPKRLIVFDTEAFRGEVIDGVETQSFRLGVSYYCELDSDLQILNDEWYNLYSPESFSTYLEQQARKDSTLYVYGHNIKYDLQLTGVLTNLIRQGWEVKTFAVDDPPTFIKLTRHRTHILFVDTFNYWQTSVEKMGQQLGMPKLVMPSNADHDEIMLIYCKQDVKILTEYLLTFFRWLQSNDLAGLGITLASQAFRSYRHRFMTHDIILHNRPDVTQLERDGYSGGRVEAYFIGTLPPQEYYKVDINSMYPYVMKERLYPYEIIGYTENLPPSKIERLIRNYYILADCTIQVDDPAYPLKSKHKLIFPVGQYRTILHQPELEYLINTGQVISIHRIAAYNQADIFSDYVDFFYDRKLQASLEGNEVTRFQSKILMNSLYGKFGQLSVKSTIMDNPGQFQFGRLTGYSESLGRSVEVNYLGDKIEIRYKQGESQYSFPAIAGAVTAYARMYLWSLMLKAGLENVFYCDTDSLITNQEGYTRLAHLLDDYDLGMLKLEGISSQVTILGAKDYRFGNEVKHKGIPKKAITLIDGSFQYQQFRGAKTWISQGMPTGVEVYTKTKSRKTDYDKGQLLTSGKVLPWRL